jgi:iron complex outermembrane receptor protein
MSRIYLEEAIPRVKANLTNSFLKKFDFLKRLFGQVTDPNTVDVRDGRVEGAIINGQAVEMNIQSGAQNNH